MGAAVGGAGGGAGARGPRVALVRPLCAGDEPEFAEPLGIERLAGYLREHGVHDVGVFDRRLHAAEWAAGLVGPDAPGFWDGMVAAHADGPPDFVGLSLMTSADLPDALRIASRVRALWPDAQLAVGGLFVTSAPEEAARRFPVGTTLMLGEGERGLLSLVTGGAGTSGSVAETSGGGAGEPLSPDAWARAWRPELVRYARLGCAVNLQSSRGCPGSCAFCATPSLPSGLSRWRPRDLALVADEMEGEATRLVAASLPPVFNFVDDDFGPLGRLEALAAELERRDLRVAWACEMRLAALTGQPNLAGRLARLAEAGLTRVFVGVESLDAGTLARWHKRYDLERLPQVVAAFRESGVRLQAGYILWHGHQTVAGALGEMRGLSELGLFTCGAALSRMIVFPGCALAGEDCATAGFEALVPEAEVFFGRLREELGQLQERWVRVAVAEPYATAAARFGCGEARARELRANLDAANAEAWEVVGRLAADAGVPW